jgi:fatty acid desaturase
MAQATTSDPARGNTLRVIATASAAIYTVFAIVIAFGGSDASYQAVLWSLWLLVMLFAAGTFAIGTAMHRSASPSAGAIEHAPALTSIS